MANQAILTPKERRTHQVREALLGLSYWMPPSIAVLYPFADGILFLTDRAATLSIWNSNCPDRPLFTTGSEHGALGEGIQVDLPSLAGSPGRVVQVEVSAQDVVGDATDRNELKAQLKELLSHDRICSTQEGRHLLRAVHAGLDEAQEQPQTLCASAYRTREARSNPVDQISSDEERWLRAVCEVVDQTIEPFAASSTHQMGSNEETFLNLFAVAYLGRSAEESAGELYFPVLLPTLGCQTLRQWAHKGGTHCDSLRQADSFSPRDVVNYVPRHALKGLASVLLDVPTDQAGDVLRHHDIAGAFCVHIHIDGFPWVGLLRLLRDEPSSWNDAFKFYREVVPRISSQLRSGLKEVYIDHLAAVLEEAVQSGGEELDVYQVNASWRRLSAAFPFDRFALNYEEQLGQAEYVGIVAGEPLWMVAHENPWFPKALEYDPLGLERAGRRCRAVLHEARQRRLEEANRVYRQFREHIEQQAHTFFNRDPWVFIENALKLYGDDIPTGAKSELDDARKAAKTQNTAFRVALRPDRPPQTLDGRHSVVKILYWLQEHTLSAESESRIEVEGDADVRLDDVTVAPAFTVLWNLWHNATKHYKTHILNVLVHNEDTGVVVKFTNLGEMPEKWVSYLCGGKYPEKDRVSGLKIVVDTLHQLGWSLKNVSVEDGTTHIALLIERGDT